MKRVISVLMALLMMCGLALVPASAKTVRPSKVEKTDGSESVSFRYDLDKKTLYLTAMNCDAATAFQLAGYPFYVSDNVKEQNLLATGGVVELWYVFNDDFRSGKISY